MLLVKRALSLLAVSAVCVTGALAQQPTVGTDKPVAPGPDPYFGAPDSNAVTQTPDIGLPKVYTPPGPQNVPVPKDYSGEYQKPATWADACQTSVMVCDLSGYSIRLRVGERCKCEQVNGSVEGVTIQQ